MKKVSSIVSASEFHEKLEACKPTWDLLAKESSCQSGFCEWFVKYKSRVVEVSMLSSGRREAGLGDPPEAFATNACESINAVVKAKVQYKKSDLPHFLMQMRELIDEQGKEVERQSSSGKYEFEDDYRHLEVPEAKWFKMTAQQRKRHLQKVATTCPKELRPCSPPVPTTGSSCSLSVPLGDVTAQITSIPAAALEGIWKKACELRTSVNSIVPAPGYSHEARMVASRTGARPHLVTKGKDAMYHCDSECANYCSLKICSHTVSVAEINGDLATFVELFSKKAKPPNITKLALHGMPSGRGRKGQQPPRKRVESTVPFQPSSNTCASSSSCSTTVLSATMSEELLPLSATMSELPPAAHGYVTPTTFAPSKYLTCSYIPSALSRYLGGRDCWE